MNQSKSYALISYILKMDSYFITVILVQKKKKYILVMYRVIAIFQKTLNRTSKGVGIFVV